MFLPTSTQQGVISRNKGGSCDRHWHTMKTINLRLSVFRYAGRLKERTCHVMNHKAVVSRIWKGKYLRGYAFIK